MPCLVKIGVTVWKYVKTEHTHPSLCTERDYLCFNYVVLMKPVSLYIVLNMKTDTSDEIFVGAFTKKSLVAAM